MTWGIAEPFRASTYHFIYHSGPLEILAQRTRDTLGNVEVTIRETLRHRSQVMIQPRTSLPQFPQKYIRWWLDMGQIAPDYPYPAQEVHAEVSSSMQP